MSTHKNTAPVNETRHDRQERRFLQLISRTAERSGATDEFITFLENAKPGDITRLSCALAEYNREPGQEQNLAQCFDNAENAGADFEEPESQEGAAESEATEGGAGIDLPEWVDNTPDETTYDLAMFEPLEGEIQNISLTRAEYIAVKAQVAKMRGYISEASND